MKILRETSFRSDFIKNEDDIAVQVLVLLELFVQFYTALARNGKL